jgi:hypothetical protein
MALGTILLLGTDAKAGFISYIATGSFSGGTTPGTSVFTTPTATVTYNNPGLQTVTPPSIVSLGTFVVNAPNTTPTAVSGTFTLTIEDVATMNTISFTGTLSGTVAVATSTASVHFHSPLTQTLDGFVFNIASADGGTPGTVFLSPTTTNGGTTTIVGLVTAPAVPEPSSIALLGISIPALLGLALRHRMKAARV